MLFPGFEERVFEPGEARIFARTGGEGKPLLMLHGYPQTGAMWHGIAGELARHFRVVVPDLRGYGRSSCPENKADNSTYSKRAMAADMVAVMAELGHKRFLVAGHDRGGRVAYRMALDHPDRVAALSVLDIVPTETMWAGMDKTLGMKAYHWLMLAQTFPLPEKLISADPVWFLGWTMASWTKAKALDGFDPEALSEYRESFRRNAYIHASCNDYRAGRTYDLAADEADLAAERRIACPVQALWGSAGFPASTGTPLDAWRKWCAGPLEGAPIDAGHFIAEENPRETLAALLPFLTKSRELVR